MRSFFASYARGDGSFGAAVELPPKLPMPQTMHVITHGRTGLTVVRVHAAPPRHSDDAGTTATCGTAAQMGGGAFAPTYRPRLAQEEQPMAQWLDKFLQSADAQRAARASDGPPALQATLHERQELLDVLRRARAACFELLRQGWFAGNPPLRIEPRALLYKCLHICNAQSTLRYAAFCRPPVTDALVLDIVWAAICEQAGLPHEPTTVLLRM